MSRPPQAFEQHPPHIADAEHEGEAEHAADEDHALGDRVIGEVELVEPEQATGRDDRSTEQCGDLVMGAVAPPSPIEADGVSAKQLQGGNERQCPTEPVDLVGREAQVEPEVYGETGRQSPGDHVEQRPNRGGESRSALRKPEESGAIQCETAFAHGHIVPFVRPTEHGAGLQFMALVPTRALEIAVGRSGRTVHPRTSGSVHTPDPRKVPRPSARPSSLLRS